MPIPTNSTLMRDIHPTLHSEHINVKAFGAVGDGVADDRTAILDAIAAMGSNQGAVYFPDGAYKISSTITLDEETKSYRFVGNAPRMWTHSRGAVVFGTFSGAVFERPVSATTDIHVSFEDLSIWNTHAAGYCLDLSRLGGSSMISKCNFLGYRCITLRQNTFNPAIIGCSFSGPGGWPAGSWGIYTGGHTNIFSVDINGFEHGIRMQGIGLVVHGGRIEVNKVGIMMGQDISGTNQPAERFSIMGIHFEANDKGIALQNSDTGIIAGADFYGSIGSPSGGSIVALDINDAAFVVIQGIAEGNTHTTNFIRMDRNTALTLIGCSGLTASSLFMGANLEVINCQGPGLTDVRHLPVIATASLPAAGATQNGRAVIEDNGAGDRNLIIYAGGQRFRIDGGAAI